MQKTFKLDGEAGEACYWKGCGQEACETCRKCFAPVFHIKHGRVCHKLLAKLLAKTCAARRKIRETQLLLELYAPLERSQRED